MTLWLHVGMPKTGTTTLQHAIAEHDRYADTRNVTGWSLDNHVYRRVDQHSYWDRILSHEAWSWCGRYDARNFRKSMPVEPQVVLTVRAAAEQMWSWYAQLVAHGESRTFDEWCHEVATLDPDEHVEVRAIRPDFAAYSWAPVAHVITGAPNIVHAFNARLGVALPDVAQQRMTPGVRFVEAARVNNELGLWSDDQREKQLAGWRNPITLGTKPEFTAEAMTWFDACDREMWERILDVSALPPALPRPPACLLEGST